MKRIPPHATNPVLVPPVVLEGIEAVRQSGRTNMLDRQAVVEIARAFGFEEAARWVETHREEYARAIFHGIAAEEPGP